MLPNRMQLSRTVEDQLKKLKSQTGLTPNVTARIAFFKAVENGPIYLPNENHKLDGILVLDKYTWLGKTQLIVELILRKKYPDFSSKNLQHAWAFHVEHGLSSLRSHRSLLSTTKALL